MAAAEGKIFVSVNSDGICEMLANKNTAYAVMRCIIKQMVTGLDGSIIMECDPSAWISIIVATMQLSNNDPLGDITLCCPPNQSPFIYWCHCQVTCTSIINYLYHLCVPGSHLFTGCGDVEGTSCGLSDLAVGGILLACSLTILLSSVIILVKVLSFILRGPMAKAIRIGINAEFPGKGKYFTGYVAMLIGAGFTMLVQSSSVFTSTLTPLVGMGLISVERMFPLTLGANIGTCVTGILAALASDPAKIQNTMQVALAHLFFNISGIIIYYPVPFMRRLPIRAAKLLGNTTAKYRWFAVAYVLFVFLLIPGAVFGLSLAGWQVLVGVLAPVAAVIISVVIVKLMQNYCPQKMHPKLRDWKWLPEPLRSLAPCNNVITRCCYNENCVRCRRKCSCKENEPDVDVESVSEPPMYCEEVIASNTAHNDSHFGQKNLGFEDINLNEQTLQTRLWRYTNSDICNSIAFI